MTNFDKLIERLRLDPARVEKLCADILVKWDEVEAKVEKDAEKFKHVTLARRMFLAYDLVEWFVENRWRYKCSSKPRS